MQRLSSYVAGQWIEGTGPQSTLVNPATEEALAETSTGGIDMGAALAHARDVGGPALRALSFAERAALLKDMSKLLHAAREELLDLAQANGGNTRGDAKFDIDGAIGTLAAYAYAGEAQAAHAAPAHAARGRAPELERLVGAGVPRGRLRVPRLRRPAHAPLYGAQPAGHPAHPRRAPPRHGPAWARRRGRRPEGVNTRDRGRSRGRGMENASFRASATG
jgi:hypothetical protein